MAEFLQIAKDFGPWAAVAGVLIWQLIHDKNSLIVDAKLRNQNYENLLERTVSALENNTVALRDLTAYCKKITEGKK